MTRHLQLLILNFLLAVFCCAQKNEQALLKKLAAEKNDSVKIGLLLDLVDALENSEPDKATQYGEQALTLARKNGFKRQIIESKIDIAHIVMARGNYPGAQKVFIETLDSSRQIRYRDGIRMSLNRLGVCARNQGNFDQAVNYYLQALKMSEEDRDSSGMGKLLSSIGVVYFKKQNYTKAIDYYEKSLATYPKGPKSMMNRAATLNNLAGALKEMKDYKRTKEIMKQTFEIKLKANDLDGLVMGYINYVYLLNELKDLKESEVYAKKARELAEQINSDDARAGALSASGELAEEMKQYDLAIGYYEKALAYHRKYNARDDIKSEYKNLFDVYTRKNNFERALYYHVMYTKLKDSLFSEESDKMVAEMSTKYDTEKKENEIHRLNSERELDQLQLDAARQEKQKQNIILLAVAGGLVLVVIFSIFIYNRFKLTQKQKSIIENQKREVDAAYTEIQHQKNQIQEHQKEIVDSITYAKRIQEAILPPLDLIREKLPQSFVIYKPKAIVAGDFYWMELLDDTKGQEIILLAVADCTGHGVPGAMVSVVCSNALNRSVVEFNLSDTGKILDKTRELVIETFEKSASDVKDGMDISLLCINRKNRTVSWSGANNSLWYIEDTELKEIKADKQPIGKSEYAKPFTTHTLNCKNDTLFYLYSDGLADQFGGPQGKKFKYKQLAALLLENKDRTPEQQAEIIDKRFTDWKGTLEQVDDVCMIGVRA